MGLVRREGVTIPAVRQPNFVKLIEAERYPAKSGWP